MKAYLTIFLSNGVLKGTFLDVIHNVYGVLIRVRIAFDLLTSIILNKSLIT